VISGTKLTKCQQLSDGYVYMDCAGIMQDKTFYLNDMKDV